MASGSVWIKIQEKCTCDKTRVNPCIYCRAIWSHNGRRLRISRMDRIIRRLCHEVRAKDRALEIAARMLEIEARTHIEAGRTQAGAAVAEAAKRTRIAIAFKGLQ